MTWIMDRTTERASDAPSNGRATGRARPSLDQIRDRIRRYNDDVDTASAGFMAAVILLVGLDYGHNIDSICRRTGYDRCLVARCARRLIDNGVWSQGRTIADWNQTDEASGTFWNDVAVAEGRMCRRLNEDGRFEWAPAGYWNKNFLAENAASQDRVANTYLDNSPDGNGAGPVAIEAGDVVVIGGPEAETDPEPFSPESANGNHDGVPSLDSVFADVVWIG